MNHSFKHKSQNSVIIWYSVHCITWQLARSSNQSAEKQERTLLSLYRRSTRRIVWRCHEIHLITAGSEHPITWEEDFAQTKSVYYNYSYGYFRISNPEEPLPVLNRFHFLDSILLKSKQVTYNRNNKFLLLWSKQFCIKFWKERLCQLKKSVELRLAGQRCWITA